MTDDAAIKDVSDTAFMVATYRAMETSRPDALFRDPLAGRLAGEHGRAIVASLPRRALFGQWFVVIRTCIIDAFIHAAVADGVDTILNLGAGLDTRPYRMELPRTLRWIEIDYPHIIALKTTRLADETPACRLERITLDLADAPERRRIFAEIAQNSHKVLVLTEGVIPYLTTREVGALADDLRAQPQFRYWIVDYLAPQTRRFRQRSERRMKMENAPFRFDPKDYFGFFAEHGWQAKEIRYIGDEAEQLGRPLALPFFWRIFVFIRGLALFGNSREAMRKSAAYVLLTPAG